MKLTDVFEKENQTASFEFFPPKTEKGADNLFRRIIEDFVPLKPSFLSITYGAGGGTRHLTRDLVLRLKDNIDIPLVSHLTCICSTKKDIDQLLGQYYDKGIRNILALRGDIPKDPDCNPYPQNGFTHAWELVEFIKMNYPDMVVGVAGFPEGHPETPNRLKEMEYLKQKVDAGADYITTQLFFDNRDFYDYKERAQQWGIDVPIIAGIMPIISKENMQKISELALGSRFPAALLRSLYRAPDEEYASKVGIHWATEQVRDLLDNGIKGVHFYTLNKSKATKTIYEYLGIKNSDALF